MSFNSIYDITPEVIKTLTREEFYNDLVELFGNTPYLETLTQESIALDIAEKIDLDDNDKSYLDKILENLYEDGGHYWNESINDLIDFYYTHFNSEGIEAAERNLYEDSNKKISRDNVGSIETAGAPFRISDLKKADAGANFVDEDQITEDQDDRILVKNPWVIPWYNIDWETYRTVRGSDRINEVLKNSNKLQFTMTQKGIDKWIRLIMPEYIRTVEVEDLNRNFWVIGQTMSAISAYLFGDTAPIPKMLDKFCDEITQLWENVVYLWYGFQVDNFYEYEEVFSTIIPVSNNEWQNFIKYDNFEQELTAQNDFVDRIKYLKDTYTKQNLCIFPEVRKNNYEKNYFSCLEIPRVLFYNRNTDTWSSKTIPFSILFTNGTAILSASGSSCSNEVYGVQEEEDQYKIYYPLKNVSSETSLNESKYYGLIRIKYDNCGCVFQNGNFYPILSGRALDIATHFYNNTQESQIFSFELNTNELDDTYSIDSNDRTQFLDVNTSVDLMQGYYQGELVSGSQSESTNYDIDLRIIDCCPIIAGSTDSNNPDVGPEGNNWVSSTTSTYMGDYDSVVLSYSTEEKTCKQFTQETLQRKIEDAVEENNSKIYFFVANHKINGYDPLLGGGWSYWIRDNRIEKNFSSGLSEFAGAMVKTPFSNNFLFYEDYGQDPTYDQNSRRTNYYNRRIISDEIRANYVNLLAQASAADTETYYSNYYIMSSKISYSIWKAKGEPLNENNWLITIARAHTETTPNLVINNQRTYLERYAFNYQCNKFKNFYSNQTKALENGYFSSDYLDEYLKFFSDNSIKITDGDFAIFKSELLPASAAQLSRSDFDISGISTYYNMEPGVLTKDGTDYNYDYFRTEDSDFGEKYAIIADFAYKVNVDVFTPQGTFAQRNWIRLVPGQQDFSYDNQWRMEEDSSKPTIDELRDGYEIINRSYYDFETFKSNGLRNLGDDVDNIGSEGVPQWDTQPTWT